MEMRRIDFHINGAHQMGLSNYVDNIIRGHMPPFPTDPTSNRWGLMRVYLGSHLRDLYIKRMRVQWQQEFNEKSKS